MKEIGLIGLTLFVLYGLFNSAPVLAAKSDFQTFDPAVAHYTGVIVQQGRVQLDADFNKTLSWKSLPGIWVWLIGSMPKRSPLTPVNGFSSGN